MTYYDDDGCCLQYMLIVFLVSAALIAMAILSFTWIAQ